MQNKLNQRFIRKIIHADDVGYGSVYVDFLYLVYFLSVLGCFEWVRRDEEREYFLLNLPKS